jgi:aminopeptidase YwaD
MNRTQTARALLSLTLLVAACASGPVMPEGWADGGAVPSQHTGPIVQSGDTGPARFAALFMEAFDPERAMKTAAFTDGYYREPGNEGFEATLDHVLAALEAVGFGKGPGLELEVIETPMRGPAWTPRSGRLAIRKASGGESEVLLAFDTPGGRARTMLPTNSRSASVAGAAVFDVDELTEGQVYVTRQPIRAALRDAEKKGAALVLSAYLPDYNTDPTGKERHLDAIHYSSVGRKTELPVGVISQRVFDAIAARAEKGDVVLEFDAVVEFTERPLRTVVATIVGKEKPDEVVAVAAHVQEPGANDNASGVAGMLEGVRAAALLILDGKLEQPRRSVAFIWGNEIQESHIFLEHTTKTVRAGFSSDMTGPSREKTGALPLLERGWDPGAVTPLPPDEHTAWGAGRVDADDLSPNGLAVIARTALIDVGTLAGGWETVEHPWEGGSDHDAFQGRGIPAVLFWHFTDFAYHTSLDRLEHLDPAELERTSVALMSAAFAVADARPEDLARYLESLDLERRLRIDAADAAGDEATSEAWQAWCTGARHWLRALCLDLPGPPDGR